MDKLIALIVVAGFAAVGGLLVAVAFGAIAAVFVMLLWNAALVGTVPGVAEIGYFAAWGMYILCSILFKTSITNKSSK